MRILSNLVLHEVNNNKIEKFDRFKKINIRVIDRLCKLTIFLNSLSQKKLLKTLSENNLLTGFHNQYSADSIVLLMSVVFKDGNGKNYDYLNDKCIRMTQCKEKKR